jgi:ABC-type branched-subunit amino acid transport system substrate-binding protein
VADELATRRAALGTDGLGALLAVISTRYPDDPVLRLPTSQKPQDRENYFWSQLFASGPNAQAPDAPANFVARFVAAATIAENPKDFGLSAQPVYLEQLLPDTIYVASVFSPDLDLPGVRDFVSKFNQYYKSRDGAAHPDLLAAQGYEAINLLGQANEMSHSVAPKDVAAVLKANTFSSITGDVAFKANGDIKGKQIILKAFRKK